MMMKIKIALICILSILASFASAQFDFGLGQMPSTTPWTEFNLNPNTKIQLNFRNASIDLVLTFFQNTTGITIIKDPAFSGPVTVTTASEVSLNEAFQVLSTVISLKNYELRKEGNFLVVRPKQTSRNGRSGFAMPEGFDPSQIQVPQIVLRVYPIKYANSAQVARVINEVFIQQQDPMMQFLQQYENMMRSQQRGMPTTSRRTSQTSQQTTVRASSDDYSNTVIVNAPEKDQAQILALINEIDKQTEQPMKSQVFKLEFATASEVAPIISNVLISNAPKGWGGQSNQRTPIDQRFSRAMQTRGANSQAFGSVTADVRTNSLVVISTEENPALVGVVIKELDTEVVYENSTFVFSLSNGRADSIASLLQQAFGNRGTTGANRIQTTTNRNIQNRNTNFSRSGGQNNNLRGGFGGGGGGG